MMSILPCTAGPNMPDTQTLTEESVLHVVLMTHSFLFWTCSSELLRLAYANERIRKKEYFIEFILKILKKWIWFCEENNCIWEANVQLASISMVYIGMIWRNMCTEFEGFVFSFFSWNEFWFHMCGTQYATIGREWRLLLYISTEWCSSACTWDWWFVAKWQSFLIPPLRTDFIFGRKLSESTHIVFILIWEGRYIFCREARRFG